MDPLIALTTFAAQEARAQDDRWFQGTITALNPDGSYQVLVADEALVLPRVYRLAHDGHKFRPGEQCTVRARGLMWDLV
jgi:hypothetical protein